MYMYTLDTLTVRCSSYYSQCTLPPWHHHVFCEKHLIAFWYRETLRNGSAYFMRLIDDDNFGSSCDEAWRHITSSPNRNPTPSPTPNIAPCSEWASIHWSRSRPFLCYFEQNAHRHHTYTERHRLGAYQARSWLLWDWVRFLETKAQL